MTDEEKARKAKQSQLQTTERLLDTIKGMQAEFPEMSVGAILAGALCLKKKDGYKSPDGHYPEPEFALLVNISDSDLEPLIMRFWVEKSEKEGGGDAT